MFGIGANELAIILLFGFLIFGPDKLPQIAKTVGRAIAKFRAAQNEMNDVLKNSVYDPSAEEGPFKNPLDAAAKVDKKVESFTERKARYDRERAERQKAEREAEQAKGQATEAAAAPGQAQGQVTEQEQAKPAIDMDALYGAHPQDAAATPKPTAAPAESPAPASAPEGAPAATGEGE